MSFFKRVCLSICLSVITQKVFFLTFSKLQMCLFSYLCVRKTQKKPIFQLASELQTRLNWNSHTKSGLVREVPWATFVFENRKLRVPVWKEQRVFPYMEDINFDIESSILAYIKDLTGNNKLNWRRHIRDHKLELNKHIFTGTGAKRPWPFITRKSKRGLMKGRRTKSRPQELAAG